jgi:hypothetical protein
VNAMKDKLVLGLATFIAARSRRLRWLVPTLPIAFGAYKLWQAREAARVIPQPEAAPAVAPKRIRKRKPRAAASRRSRPHA